MLLTIMAAELRWSVRFAQAGSTSEFNLQTSCRMSEPQFKPRTQIPWKCGHISTYHWQKHVTYSRNRWYTNVFLYLS